MNYFYIEPEVSGEFGDSTVMGTSKHPPVIHNLVYNFQGWLGDHLLECFPCFIASTNLIEQLNIHNITGYKIEDVVITKDSQLTKLERNLNLPEFKWFQVSGIEGVNDCFIASDNRLVISDRFLSILKENGNQYFDIEEYS